MRTTRAGTTDSRGRGRGTAVRALALSAVAGMLASGTGTALAIPTGPGIGTGQTITVFHNVDFVALEGFPATTPLTVEVIRDGITIGTAAGSTDEAGAFEINHDPGACWSNHTPDLRPLDRIVVNDGTRDHEMTIDDVVFTSATPEQPSSTQTVVRGIAQDPDGSPMALNALVHEFRGDTADGTRVRVNGDLARDTTSDDPAAFTATYNTTDPAVHQALSGQGHMLVADSGGSVAIVDGLDDVVGPSGNCTSSPAASDAVTSVNPDVLNIATLAEGGNLVMSGLAISAGAVQARIEHPNGSTLLSDAVLATAPATGPDRQTWTASRTRASVNLPDGLLTVAMVKDGAVVPDRTLPLLKDTVAPVAPTATPGSGTYSSQQAVTLVGESGSTVHYTIGGPDVAPPTSTDQTAAPGQQIIISSTQTLKAMAVDAAGNPGAVATFTYTMAEGVFANETGASGSVQPGGTVTTLGPTASAGNPLVTSVTSPQGGQVDITEQGSSGAAPAGYTLLGSESVISAPAATAGSPLRLVFRLDASMLAGEDGRAVSVWRDGVLVATCTSNDGSAAPDPCVASRTAEGDDTVITVLTSQASTWTFAVPAVASIGAACTGITGESFTDVGADNTHAAAIDCLSGRQITGGIGGGQYGPARSVTRAQMAAFVHRLLTRSGMTLPGGDPNRFTDVSGIHADAINSLAEAGIINGTTATTYGSNQSVTRAQMAALLDRGYQRRGGLRTGSTVDAFTDDDNSPLHASINNLAAMGITTGKTSTTYDPNSDVRRDQMASFLTRLVSRLTAEGTTS